MKLSTMSPSTAKTEGRPSTSDAELERKYRMVVNGRVTKLPYSLAKKAADYSEWCVSGWHAEERQQARPAARYSNLCDECKDLLRGSWATMARHWADLQEAVRPDQSFGNGERVSGAGGLYPPLPIDATVSDLLRDIRDAVASTIDGLIDDRPGWKMPASPTTDVLADQLAKWHVEYIATHPSPGHSWVVLQEAYEIACRIDRQMERIAPEEPTTRRVIVYGKCWQHSVAEDGSLIRCHGKLHGVLRDGLDGRVSEIRCSDDPAHVVPESEWIALLRMRTAKVASRRERSTRG